MSALSFLDSFATNFSISANSPKKEVISSQKTKKTTIQHSDSVVLKKGQYKGYYGNVLKFFPTQYNVRVGKDIVRLTKQEFDKKDEVKVVVMKGKFKGEKGEIVKKFHKHLEIFVEALGRKISKHMVTDKGDYIERDIYPSDVFFADILLKDGAYIQVVSVDGDKISGFKNGQAEKIYSLKNDVEKFGKNFKFEKDMYEEEEVVSELPDFVYDEVEEEVPQPKMIEEQEFKSSYKDKERVEVEHEPLSKTQESMKTKIEKLYSYMKEPFSGDIYTMVGNVDDVVKVMKKLLKNASIKEWVKNDVNYIISVIVYRNLLRTNKKMQKSNFIGVLEKKKFVKNDFSMFLKSGWTDLVKDEESVKDGFSAAERFVDSVLGKTGNSSTDVSEILKVFPLTKEVKTIEKKTMTIPGLIKNNGKVDVYTKVLLWGEKYLPLLNEYKEKTKEKMDTVKESDKKKLMYIFSNLEQAPIVLRDYPDNEYSKHLMKMWNNLYQNLENEYQECLTEKTTSQTNLEQQRQILKERRQDIATERSMKGLSITGTVSSAKKGSESVLDSLRQKFRKEQSKSKLDMDVSDDESKISSKRKMSEASESDKEVKKTKSEMDSDTELEEDERELSETKVSTSDESESDTESETTETDDDMPSMKELESKIVEIINNSDLTELTTRKLREKLREHYYKTVGLFVSKEQINKWIDEHKDFIKEVAYNNL